MAAESGALFGGYPADDPSDMERMVAEGVRAFKLFTGELSGYEYEIVMVS